MPTNYGGPSLTPEEIEPRKAAMTRRAGRKPFESFKLTNNNVVLYPHMSCGKKGAANKFRGKKAADITMKQEMRTRYLKEVWAQLLSAEYTVEYKDDHTLQVELDGNPLCQVCDTGNLQYFKEDAVGREKALDQLRDIVSATWEYMNLLDRAPPLMADGLGEGYKLLAEFNNAVLAGHLTEYGAQFVTWEWVHDRTSLWQGHYHGPGGGVKGYDAAKRDFAVRSGLLQKNALFQPEQLVEVYRSIHETLDSAYSLTDSRRKLLEDAARQIEEGAPDLGERMERSNQEELDLGSTEIHSRDGMQFN